MPHAGARLKACGAHTLPRRGQVLNVLFATMFYLGLWRPTRRGARFLDQLNPPFPEKSAGPLSRVLLAPR